VANQFHHEEHEGHEVLNVTNGTIFLRDLRALRGENWVAAGRAVIFALQSVSTTHVREDFFSRRERRERREKAGNKVRHAVLLRDLCASARTCSFPQGLGLGLRAVPGLEGWFWNEMF
jgi:hypothetical protein